MGFDTETKDGHCIYWPEKRSVTVKRSVKFNFKDEIEISIPILPLGKDKPEMLPVVTSDEDVEKMDEVAEILSTEGQDK